MTRMARGEIWLLELDPTVGREIRPCVIVSPLEMHDYLRTLIVAPMTTGSKPAPFRIAVTHAGKQGLILLDQLRVVDKVRLVTKVGAANPNALTAVLNALREQFSQ